MLLLLRAAALLLLGCPLPAPNAALQRAEYACSSMLLLSRHLAVCAL